MEERRLGAKTTVREQALMHIQGEMAYPTGPFRSGILWVLISLEPHKYL